jgi:hypothetical protein
MLALYQEPDSITAGNSLAWSRQLPAYPPTAGWALSYSLQNGSQTPIAIPTTVAADNYTYLVNVLAATTAGWAPGAWLWTAIVTNAGTGQRLTSHRGSVSILPNPTAAIPASHAQTCLSMVEAAIEGRLPRGLESYTIDGQEIAKIPLPELYKLRQKYQAEVYLEKQKLDAQFGIGSRRSIGVRFRRPGLPFGSPGVITTGPGA